MRRGEPRARPKGVKHGATIAQGVGYGAPLPTKTGPKNLGKKENRAAIVFATNSPVGVNGSYIIDFPDKLGVAMM